MLETCSLACPPIEVAPGLSLARGRAHEVTGPSRIVFALFVGRRMTGEVLWLQLAWTRDRLFGDGVAPIMDPCRLVIGRGRGAVDLLWCAEEALRSGLMPLVVAELPAPPTLTAVRRLHLAAEAGGEARGTAPPLVLLLTPEPGGTAGVETRWRLAPAPGWAVDERPRWQLRRLRARMAPEAAWEMGLDRAGDPCVVPWREVG
jgi:protein ImuA